MRERLRRAHARLRRAERGATAIVLAICMIMLMAAGAVGLDISRILAARQLLRTAVDAAAQAAAIDLPANPATAISDATTYALANYADLGNDGSSGRPNYAPKLVVTLYCVTAATVSGTNATVDETQATNSCNPGTKGTDWTQPGGSVNPARCSATTGLCYIPCRSDYTVATCQTTSRFLWNTVVITAAINKLPLVFGPAINIPTATTGTLSSASCMGQCGGGAPPNPMNVVVMADRTGSMYRNVMNTSNLDALKAGLANMVSVMNPKQQFLAMGALAISKFTVDPTDPTAPLGSADDYFTHESSAKDAADPTPRLDNYADCSAGKPLANQVYAYHSNQFRGTWVPVDYSANYAVTTTAGVQNVTSPSDLSNAVNKLTFNSWAGNFAAGTATQYCTHDTYDQGTHLASMLKGAAQYLLDPSKLGSSPNVSSADIATRDTLRGALPIRNVIVLETDGVADERFTESSADMNAALVLAPGSSNTNDIGTDDDAQACSNFQTVASNAKALGITIITIGFGSTFADGTAKCGSTYAAPALAAIASTKASVTGQGDAVQNSCNGATNVAKENTDGDYFFCAPDAATLKTVFAAAMNSVLLQTKFVSFGDANS